MRRQVTEGPFAALNRYHKHQPEEEGKGEEYKRRPQNPHSPYAASWPPGAEQSEAGAPTPRLPQTPALAFNGATYAETAAIPPDPMGAVGPSQYFLTLNGRFRVFDKATGTLGPLNMDSDVFFSSVLSPVAGTFTSDPRVRYDRQTQRWFVAMIDVPRGGTSAANRVLVAMSDGPVITAGTNWSFWYFQVDQTSPAGDSGSFGDYPTLGIDSHALYIGLDMFAQSGSYNTTAFVVRKSALLAGEPIVVSTFRRLINSNKGPVTPQGVDNLDIDPAYGYFIGTDYSAYGALVLRRISDPGGTPSISANINVTVPATAYPITVPHMGNTRGAYGNLDGCDDRLFSGVIRDGILWTSHSIGVTSSGVASTSLANRVASRWYALANLNTAPTLLQSGTLYDAAATDPLSFIYPGLMVSGQGHIAMGFTVSGAASYINAAVTGRLAADALGALREVTPLTDSTTAYNPLGDTGNSEYGRRWGDYSYTSLDPEDDMTMWTVQQWCQAANSYACRVVKLMAPPPAQPSSANPAILAAGTSNVEVTITGDTTGGAGFFDPGTGFPKRLTSSVSGTGVNVNSVAFISPSQVRLNVSVSPVAGGNYTVTITNPDGQSASAESALLTVNGTYGQADVVAALRIAGGLLVSLEADVARLDRNGDGQVTQQDAEAILRMVAGS